MIDHRSFDAKLDHHLLAKLKSNEEEQEGPTNAHKLR